MTGLVNNVENETIYVGSSLRPMLPVIYNQHRAPRTYGMRVAFSF